jgi:molecular chaperone GrpE (heat shock protein)
VSTSDFDAAIPGGADEPGTIPEPIRDPAAPPSLAGIAEGGADTPAAEATGEYGVAPAAVSMPDPADLVAAILQLERHVSAETGRILQAFTEKLAFDRFKEDQVAQLHAELQQHREGMLERATRPLLNAVIRVHDNLGKVVASLRTRPQEELTPERTFRVLDGFREDLELLLAQHGVEPFDPLDDRFDPRLHTALRTVHTDDPVLTGRIAERLRPGFSHGEALLQKARVAVFTAQSAPRAPGQPTAPIESPANGEQG